MIHFSHRPSAFAVLAVALALSAAPQTRVKAQAPAPLQAPENAGKPSPSVITPGAPAQAPPPPAAPYVPPTAAPTPLAPMPTSPERAPRIAPSARAPAKQGSTTTAQASAERSDASDASAGLDSLKQSLEPSPNGLTEAEVVAAALKTSPALRKSQLDADKASANHARAKLAIFPRLDLSARYTRLSKVPLPTIGVVEPPPVDVNPRDGNVDFVPPDPNAELITFPQVLDQYATQASLTVPITDLFLVILPTYDGTKMLRDVAAHQEQAQEGSVAYQARVAFYDYIRAKGAAIVAVDSVRVLENHVNDLQVLSSAGAATETDVIRAQARLSGAKVTAAQYEGQVDIAIMRLSRMLGTELDLKRGIAEPVVDFDPGESPLAGDVLTKAFAQRHELLALRALQRAREKLASAKRGGQWPRLSATGNVYYANPNQRIFPQTEEFNESWDVGIALTFSPNDFAIARTQATDAEMDLEQVAQDIRLIEDAIAVEAATAVTYHRTARERIAATTQNLDASLRFFEDQQNLMKAGAATPSDVLEAEAELRRAQLEWVNAHIEARMAQAALIKARGDTGVARGPRSSR